MAMIISGNGYKEPEKVVDVPVIEQNMDGVPVVEERVGGVASVPTGEQNMDAVPVVEDVEVNAFGEPINVAPEIVEEDSYGNIEFEPEKELFQDETEVSGVEFDNTEEEQLLKTTKHILSKDFIGKTPEQQQERFNELSPELVVQILEDSKDIKGDIVQLAHYANLPIQVVKDDPDYAWRVAEKRALKKKKLPQAVYSELRNNPDSIAALKDNFDVVDQLTKALINDRYINGTHRQSFTDKLVMGYESGATIVDMAEYKNEVESSLKSGRPLSLDLMNRLDNINLVNNRVISEGSLPSQMLVETSRILPALFDTAGSALYRSVQGAASGLVLGSVGGVAGAIAGAGLGAKAGAGIGFAETTYDMHYVGASYDYSRLKVNGKYLSPEEIDTAAKAQAIINSGLDLAGTAALGVLFKGASKPVNSIISSAVKTKTGRASLAKIASAKWIPKSAKDVVKGAVGLGVGAGVEGVTEGSQEVVLDAFGELAKEWTAEGRSEYYNRKDILNPETVERAIEAAKMAAMGALPLAVASAGVGNFSRLVLHKQKAEQSHTEQETIERIIEANNNTTLADTDSNLTVLNQTLTATGNEVTYMDASDLKAEIEILANDGFDANNTPWIETINSAINQAESTGKQVELKTSEVVQILNRDRGEVLRKHMTLSEDGSSTHRSGIDNEEIERSIRESIDQFEVGMTKAEDVASLTQTIRDELVSTGVVDDNVARLLSTIIPAWANVKTEGTDKFPSQLIADLGLSIDGKIDLNGVLGNFNLGDGLINLSTEQDLSTFLHEVGHFMLDAEQRTEGIDSISAIFPEIAEHLEITEEQVEHAFLNPDLSPVEYEEIQEFFARSFEAYLKKGESPSIELSDSFRAIKEWMNLVYKGTERQDMDVSSDVKAMFDNMFVYKFEPQDSIDFNSDTDIMMANVSRLEDAYNSLVNDANSTDAEIQEAKSAKDVAERELNTILTYIHYKADNDINAGLIDAYTQDAIKKATNSVDSNPIVLIVNAMKKNEWLKLDADDAKDALGVDTLPADIQAITSDSSLLSITDIISSIDDSNQFNNMTIEAFLESVQGLESREKMIEQEYQKLMLDAPQVLTDENMQDYARMTVDAENDVGSQELELISNMDKARLENGDSKINSEAIKQKAIDALYRLNILTMSGTDFNSRMNQSISNYNIAVRVGDKQRIADTAFQALLNNYIYTESLNIKQQYRDISKNLNKFKAKSRQVEIKKFGGNFWDRISILLGNAGIIPANEVSANIKAYNEWVNSSELIRPPSTVTALDSMPFGEVTAINDIVNSLYVAGSTHNQLMIDGELSSLNEIVRKIKVELDEHGKNVDLSHSKTKDQQISNKGREALSITSILPWSFKILSNVHGVVQSTLQNALDRPLTLAIQESNILFREHMQPIIDVFQRKDSSLVLKMKEGHKITSLEGNKYIIDGKMTGNQIVAFALNVGTQNNLNTLLRGYEIIGANDIASIHHPVVQEVIGHLNKGDWAIVQEIWKQIDNLFEPFSDLERRVRGKDLVKESGIRIPTKNHGVIHGMYYPLLRDKKYQVNYDEGKSPEQNTSADTLSLFFGDYNSEFGDQLSASKERTEGYYPVLLDSSTASINHITSVIHLISHYDAIESASKLISNKEFRAAYQKAAGVHGLNALDTWLKETANTRNIESSDIISRAFRDLRIGTTLVMLGGSIFKTVPKQLLGILFINRRGWHKPKRL
ncbi:hypothetical protein BJAS_P3970 [Bathymodiolus japonicus methanotrophic gill symbiont]|uniref:hypothetical protein n=1 Tax=Bathymodiolus japonicus methanotrophic gill symbiont TaxID=113269 RepID=UPI001B691B38|nr:hypothetical protein [Bathymodiolus japonicus methanotrophic gill symbiont]GFO73258.1 hypothetical protein BJAS_P3970 [Bathymodiolus japonicus methanotrophic gill symbiont]